MQGEKTIQICVFSPIGKQINLILPVTTRGLQVKLECLRSFGESKKISVDNYKLLKARIQFELDENVSLEEANIINNGM